MLQKYNKWIVLKVFFENPEPSGGFQLREISRKVNLAPTSVKRYLNNLVKENLIIKEKHRIHNYPIYTTDLNSDEFRFLKKTDTIFILRESGLLEYINNQCMPDVMILFGSASRGEDLIDSDIDLFIQSKERSLDLKKYEKILKRKVSIFFAEDFKKLSKEFRNNIINGIILSGYLKVF